MQGKNTCNLVEIKSENCVASILVTSRVQEKIIGKLEIELGSFVAAVQV